MSFVCDIEWNFYSFAFKTFTESIPEFALRKCSLSPFSDAKQNNGRTMQHLLNFPASTYKIFAENRYESLKKNSCCPSFSSERLNVFRL